MLDITGVIIYNIIMSDDIFISYAREDLEWVKTLVKHLEQNGWSVWWDREIPAGKAFREVIESALKEAKCMLVVWSQHSITSRWVLEETEEGARRKILAPVMKDDVGIPFGYRQYHAASLTDWDGSSTAPVFQQLLENITGITGISPTPPPPAPAPEPPPSPAPKKKKKPAAKKSKPKPPETPSPAQTPKRTTKAAEPPLKTKPKRKPKRKKPAAEAVHTKKTTPRKWFNMTNVLIFLVGLTAVILGFSDVPVYMAIPVLLIGAFIVAVVESRFAGKPPKD